MPKAKNRTATSSGKKDKRNAAGCFRTAAQKAGDKKRKKKK